MPRLRRVLRTPSRCIMDRAQQELRLVTVATGKFPYLFHSCSPTATTCYDAVHVKGFFFLISVNRNVLPSLGRSWRNSGQGSGLNSLLRGLTDLSAVLTRWFTRPRRARRLWIVVLKHSFVLRERDEYIMKTFSQTVNLNR